MDTMEQVEMSNFLARLMGNRSGLLDMMHSLRVRLYLFPYSFLMELLIEIEQLVNAHP